MTISFKLEPVLAKALEERARLLKQPSLHIAARQILIESLTDAQRTRLCEEVEKLTQEVTRLRTDLATATVALLVQAGRINDVEEARQWVAKTLLP